MLVWGLFFLIVAFYIPLVSAIQALLQVCFCFPSPLPYSPLQ